METYSMATKKISVTYHPTTIEVLWPLVFKNLNNDNKCQKNMKKLQALSKNAKIHDGKKLKTIPLQLETMH